MGEDMNLRLFRTAAPFTLALLLAATPASAHHVMGGKTPSTLFEGLLSGLGHPVIGADHLAFLVAVGIVIGVGGLDLAFAALFVVAMAAGVALHVASLTLPGSELVVALSVLVAGVLVARGRALPTMAWAALFAAAGLFHGYAFGESIFGAEASPLGAYLVGLVIVQSALVVGVALLVRRLGAGIASVGPRLAGAAIGGIGFAVLIAQLVPAP
jgi:urease accessory protein